jgi:anti-sigma regulatory factor (Ser/Thr protein kinase)
LAEITLQAVVSSIPNATGFIEGELEAVGCPIKTQMQIDVAVDEVFTNIASYAYGDEGGSATIRFEFDPETRTVEITFTDSGVPFDPMTMKDPDVTLSAEERPIGGLGIFLEKKTMDSVSYQYRDGQNQLTIRKKI